MINLSPAAPHYDQYEIYVAAVWWWRGTVVSVVHRINEVTLRRARLVLGWVTVFRQVYHHGM